LAGRVLLKIVYLLVRRVLSLAGTENLCHLAGCSADRWPVGHAFGACQVGVGLPGRGMIFGLWA
jgi:hypothetical protein